MNIAHIEPENQIYGPGNRFVIWTQGCSIHCKGCWNKNLWSFSPNTLLPVEKIMEQILEHKDSIEGVTLLGGEPLDQFPESLLLLQKIKKIGLSTMLYSGYEFDLIQKTNFKQILAVTDILISGRYVEERRNTNLQWRGSENQEVHFLSEIYRNFNIEEGNYMEIHISSNGQIQAFGFPEKNSLNKILG